MNPTDHYLDAVSTLLPAPSLTVELLSLFKNPDRDLDQIVKVISYEPALTAEILKRCNSAFFGTGEPATNVFEALTRLGFYEVYCIVATTLAGSATSLPGVHEGVDVEQLWQHLIITAIAASEVAETIGEPKEVAFTCGLLHDIGKLVLASAERSRYSRLQQESNGFGLALVHAEGLAFDVNHASLGGLLLARWKLPTNIATAIMLHHSSWDCQVFVTLAGIVAVADQIAHTIADHDRGSFEDAASSTRILQRLNLGPSDIASILARTEKSFESHGSLAAV